MSNEYKNSEWYALLEQEIAASTMTQVAQQLGYSMTALSLICQGKYAGKTTKFASKVLQVFGKVNYPGLEGKSIAECRNIATSPAPTHNPSKMEIWKLCKKWQQRIEQGV